MKRGPIHERRQLEKVFDLFVIFWEGAYAMCMAPCRMLGHPKEERCCINYARYPQEIPKRVKRTAPPIYTLCSSYIPQ